MKTAYIYVYIYKSLEISSFGVIVVRKEHPFTVGGSVVCIKNNMEISQKIRIELPYDSKKSLIVICP